MLHAWHTQDLYIPRYGQRGPRELMSWHHAKTRMKNEVINEPYCMNAERGFYYTTRNDKLG